MYCPNCGSQNNKKQNYCRFCGLRLSAIEKLFSDQIIFGEDSKRLRNLKNVRKLLEYLTVLLFILIFVGIFLWFSYDHELGRTVMRLSLLANFLVQAIRMSIGYIQRQGTKKGQVPDVPVEDEQGEFVARKTNKLIEEKPFVPASRVTEAETRLLYADRNSGGLKQDG